MSRHSNPIALTKGMDALRQAGIATAANITIIEAFIDPREPAKALVALHKADPALLAGDHTSNPNLNAIKNHPDPVRLANGIIALHKEGILDDDSRALIASRAYTDIDNLAVVLIALKKADIPIPDKLKKKPEDGYEKNYNDLASLAQGLSELEKRKIPLTQENLDTIIGSQQPLYATAILITLHEVDPALLNNANRAVIKNSQNLKSLMYALHQLQHPDYPRVERQGEKGILNQTTFNRVTRDPNPINCANGLVAAERVQPAAISALSQLSVANTGSAADPAATRAQVSGCMLYPTN